ncbi:MAG: peptidylprolyl isomerase, partial [Spirochaetota bacterium]
MTKKRHPRGTSGGDDSRKEGRGGGGKSGSEPGGRRGGKKPEWSFKKLLVTLVIGFVAVAFVGSFAYNYTARRGGGDHLAVVNGEPIDAGSDSLFANYYRQFYEQMRQEKGEEQITEQENRQLLRQALDTAIQRTLILQYAEKSGLQVSRNAVLARIMEKGYYGTQDSLFDQERYQETPESDRQQVFRRERQQMIIELFVDELIGGTRVSDLDVRSFYRLTDYGKKIEYVYIRYDDVPEEKLRAFYRENPRLFEQAHAAHILIKDDPDKAREVHRRVLEEPDRFAEIAREVSEDATAEKGGDLGWFYRAEMVPEFAQAAFNLEEGEISEPVKTVFGHHIIKALEPVRSRPFEEALFRVKREYVLAHEEEVEKRVAGLSRDLLARAGGKPEDFTRIARAMELAPRNTDYISVEGRYILNEERDVPLYELMEVQQLPDVVFSTPVGEIGGPVKTADGEI